jgi:ABC-type branched-subunit amino acid transport system substrate-binding protein
MRRRAFVFLLGTLGLASCQSSEPGPTVRLNQLPSSGTVRTNSESGPVAILLPLTGRMAEIGQSMLKAAQLALSVPGSPTLIVKDTGGSPEQAARVAAEAINEGAKMLLGPVTSAETAMVSPVARRAGVPELAFTNDQSQSRLGVWTLGITPGQQVRRLVEAVNAASRGPIAALLPDNDFGRAMASELTRILAEEGRPEPIIRMYGPGQRSIADAVDAVAAMNVPGQTPAFNALLLGAVGGPLRAIAQALDRAHIDRADVQILGPGLWIDPASGSGVLEGAWFALPDPDRRRAFIRDFAAKYKEGPSPVADLANDAASIARVLGPQGRMDTSGLTQAAGFAGVDGWFRLLPDGQVRRSLALFAIDRNGHAEKIAAAAAAAS